MDPSLNEGGAFPTVHQLTRGLFGSMGEADPYPVAAMAIAGLEVDHDRGSKSCGWRARFSRFLAWMAENPYQVPHVRENTASRSHPLPYLFLSQAGTDYGALLATTMDKWRARWDAAGKQHMTREERLAQLLEDGASEPTDADDEEGDEEDDRRSGQDNEDEAAAAAP